MNYIREFATGLFAMVVAAAPAIVVASTYSDAVNALNPDAYYRGEEGSGAPLDTTAGAHHLAESNNNTWGTGPTDADGLPGMGAVNGAYQFTGPQSARSGDAVGSAYIPAVGQAPRTVIAWIRMDTRGSADLGGPNNIWSWGMSFDGSDTFTNFALFIDEAYIPSTGGHSGSQNVHLNIQGRQIAALDTPITYGPDAKWHQVAIAFEGDGTAPLSAAEIYIDGTPQTNLVQDVGAIPVTGGVNTPGAVMGFRLGQTHGGWGFNGKVDEISVHTEKLSGATIRNLYDVAAGVPEPSSLALAAWAGIGALRVVRRRVA